MMTRLGSLFILVASGSFVCGPVLAAERILDLDPAASEVSFDLEATGHDVHGTFGFQRGRVVFDSETGKASGEIVVDAQLGDSGNEKRDKTMHGKVLESEQFRLFVFAPQRFEGEFRETGSSELQFYGTMRIHGETHPLTLTTVVKVDGDDAAVQASFDIPFVDWGMRDPSFLFLRVAKQVQVTVSTRGTLSGSGENTTAASGR